MIDLITLQPKNNTTPDWRHPFNVLSGSEWHLLAATTSTMISIPDETRVILLNSNETIIVSPVDILVVPTAGSPVTGQFEMNIPVLQIEDDATEFYIWGRGITDVVINFYKG